MHFFLSSSSFKSLASNLIIRSLFCSKSQNGDYGVNPRARLVINFNAFLLSFKTKTFVLLKYGTLLFLMLSVHTFRIQSQPTEPVAILTLTAAEHDFNPMVVV